MSVLFRLLFFSKACSYEIASSKPLSLSINQCLAVRTTYA